MISISELFLNKLLSDLANRDGFVFLDTARPDQENSASYFFLEPMARIQFRNGDDLTVFFDEVESFQAKGCYLAGWISYELGYLLEDRLRNLLQGEGDQDCLLADLGVYEQAYIYEHDIGECDYPFLLTDDAGEDNYQIENLETSLKEDEYLKNIAVIKDYISAGDTYQVNFTLKLFFDFSGSAEALYKVLRRNQTVSYGAYIRNGEDRILSFSPELFFRKEQEKVVVRPMKGTLRRGRFLEEDGEKCQNLQQDSKNRSENVMIVDLLRNDLGHLVHRMKEGNVQVESLFDVEVYESLLQMTSTIMGSAGAGGKNSIGKLSFAELLKNLFPCGSVTGAPKIRTMEIIDELEGERRGVYTGAIGYLGPEGEAVFNVPIRTVVLNDYKGEMGIGSGIVHDSDPFKEWQECLLKGDFLTKPVPEFKLIETILWRPDGGYVLLNEHLQRLSQSAAYFLFRCDPKEIREKLALESSDFQESMRVRLTLAKDSSLEIVSTPCPVPVNWNLPHEVTETELGLPQVILAEEKTDSKNPWFFHKTTRRDIYDRQFSKAREQGYYEVLFLNEREELTEGCISNLLICLDGCFYTPPLQSGLLNGTMRAHLLTDGERPLKEKVLLREDLEKADAIFVCNSVRGVVQVQLTKL